jgi:RND family efflux transporter MFP subunit
MNSSTSKVAAVLLSAISSAVYLDGCARNEAAPAPELPQVSVAQVLTRDITEFDEFTGHFEAVRHVDVRPRVSGYIASVNFSEGGEVHQGEVLFVIDPRPYAAELKRAHAELAQARSRRELAQSERNRAVKLLASHAISREEFETRVAASEESDADVDAAQAAVDTAALNLGFTRVISPIDGVAGRALITAGNFVAAGQTLVTTVVSEDPIYVTFEGDESAYLRDMDPGLRARREVGSPVWVGLVNETDYTHRGILVFTNNELDAATGTIRARARLDNPDHRYTPGMFARIKLPASLPHEAVLINDSAVSTDQSIKYVLVVGQDHKVRYRVVSLGPLVDGLRVVREGLSPGEVIVVDGLQHVRPGMLVSPERVAMGEAPTGADPGAHATLLAHDSGGHDPAGQNSRDEQ